MQPPDLDQLLEDDESSGGINQDTARYLAYIEQQLYADIQVRKRFDSGLLFLTCQIGSASLAWLLFSLQVTLIIIQVASISVALLPGLIDFSDTFSFELSSERWEIRAQNKPLASVVKLGIGTAMGWTSTKTISQEVFKTHEAIKNTYSEIKASEKANGFHPPQMLILVVVVLGLLALVTIFKLRANDVQTK
ncbi:hypothetical protein NIES21_61170 (plasmid) [Anabaenopsis circularis NIES-21]|uniref:Uncharacterized protein n=1 Tax=Anabaenopsis circularis NIES-21 TaxID=1085406 RepID=A0A1Z4GRY8_9CYAN|nr:hypothetical protein NIES21_61170 [Anabaenopsis circularis NIES-21]